MTESLAYNRMCELFDFSKRCEEEGENEAAEQCLERAWIEFEVYMKEAM